MGFREFLNEKDGVLVYVDDGSRYEDPDRKTIKYIEDGVKRFKGELEDVTDKGPYFKFKDNVDARDFVKYINKYSGPSIFADIRED